jgi:hypothetical protein
MSDEPKDEAPPERKPLTEAEREDFRNKLLGLYLDEARPPIQRVTAGIFHFMLGFAEKSRESAH